MAKDKHVFNWQLYVGIILLVTGGLFLADQLLGISILAYAWPLLVLLFGLILFLGMLVAGKVGAWLAIPAAVISTMGILLFIQNLFDLWVTWVYAWALLISATGVGMLIMNGYLKRDGLRRAAGVVIGLGLVLFVVFGILFELILNVAGSDVHSGLFLGAGLILLGLFMVFNRLLFGRKQPAETGAVSDQDVLDDVSTAGLETPNPTEKVSRLLADGAEFTSLVFKSLGDVFLIQGDQCDLRIEGDPSLIDKVTTHLQDEELKITYAIDVADWTGLQWINTENRLRYYVTVKALKQVHLGGAGVIRADQLHGDHLKVRHAGIGALTLSGLHYRELEVTLGGLGEIRFEGEVTSQVVALTGGGSYHAVDLHSQEAEITLTGAGSAQVWVDEKLLARLSGAGNILYKGEPQVDQTITGLGDVKPL